MARWCEPGNVIFQIPSVTFRGFRYAYLTYPGMVTLGDRSEEKSQRRDPNQKPRENRGTRTGWEGKRRPKQRASQNTALLRGYEDRNRIIFWRRTVKLSVGNITRNQRSGHGDTTEWPAHRIPAAENSNINTREKDDKEERAEHRLPCRLYCDLQRRVESLRARAF